MATLYLNDNQISDISALSKYASLNELKLQNNNISNIEPLRTLFDSCSFKVNFEDFLYYYNSMDDLRGNIVCMEIKLQKVSTDGFFLTISSSITHTDGEKIIKAVCPYVSLRKAG